MKNHVKNRVELTNIQTLIGKRMLQSKLTKPCFYIRSSADVTQFMGMRHKLKKSSGVKITTNAFYIRTLALAVKEYPLMMAKLDGAHLIVPESVNVGFAVNAPHGLVVPVIKDADKKSLVEIAGLEKLYTNKARSNKLTLQDIEAKTIAISNLGAYDIDAFLGIVPPTTSAILAVGGVIRTIVSADGQPTKRKIVSLSLAVDHRVINGDYAAKFLSCITEQLQTPEQLI